MSTDRDDVIRMAREAGASHLGLSVVGSDFVYQMFERFADLVDAKATAREREACAQVAMEFRRGAGDPVCGEVAKAIRARGAA